jgi:hypothetical protein
MVLTLNWTCDDCGTAKAQTVKYDWTKGLGDVWHPRWLKGFGKKVLCESCYQEAWDKDRKDHPGQVWTA